MPFPSSRRQPDRAPTPLVLSTDEEEGLRRAQLALLAEFDRVCTAHGLEYFALYGTLLGAIRHGGFIPWDDDLDVGMLRPDYDRLAEVIGDELAPGFLFQTARTDPHCGYLFGKLRREGTRCVDRMSYGSPQHGGIFIDVFPLDVKASGPWTRREQKVMRYVGFRLLYLKVGYLFITGTSVGIRAVKVIARLGIRLVPRRLIIAFTERHTRLGRKGPADQYVSLFGAYNYDRDTIDAAWIHPLRAVPFEGVTIPVLADSDAYLTQLYGDYRQPPPPEQQVGLHEFVELDFGGAPSD